MSYVKKLAKKGLLQGVPSWMLDNVHYEVVMGSNAYGVSEDDSDFDVYGWVMPPKLFMFPHLTGHIRGFGPEPENFETFQQHHVKDPDALGGRGREYDFSICSLVKFVNLCKDNNPNMLDSLFVPRNCVLTCTPLADKIRRNRTLFVHKGCFHRFRGYAYSQLHKMEGKNPEPGSKREASVKKYGYDIKFGYHVVRLALECEQLLETGDLILDRDAELLKSIRRGEWTREKIIQFFEDKERRLTELYEKSELRYEPDLTKIRALLLEVIETHYGSIEGMEPKDKYYDAMIRISKIVSDTLK